MCAPQQHQWPQGLFVPRIRGIGNDAEAECWIQGGKLLCTAISLGRFKNGDDFQVQTNVLMSYIQNFFIPLKTKPKDTAAQSLFQWADDAAFHSTKVHLQLINHQKMWEKCMQIGLLNFDSKWEKKRELVFSRRHLSCHASLARKSNEAILPNAELTPVAADTISFKCALFWTIFTSQLHSEL